MTTAAHDGQTGEGRATCTGDNAQVAFGDEANEIRYATDASSTVVYIMDEDEAPDGETSEREDAARSELEPTPAPATYTMANAMECSSYQIVRTEYTADSRTCLWWGQVDPATNAVAWSQEGYVRHSLSLQFQHHHMAFDFMILAEDGIPRLTQFNVPVRMRKHVALSPDITTDTAAFTSGGAYSEGGWGASMTLSTDGTLGTFFTEIHDITLVDAFSGARFQVVDLTHHQSPRFDCVKVDYSCTFQDA